MKYRKKSVTIEAEQFFVDKLPHPIGIHRGPAYCSTRNGGNWCELHKADHLFYHYYLECSNYRQHITDGDWVIQGINEGINGREVCPEEVFKVTYEEVEE